MFYFVWLFYVRLCAQLGAKRIIGGYAGFFYGVFFGIFGIMIVLSSRRLDDERSDAMLKEKYKPVQS
jgi:hypothetical protein